MDDREFIILQPVKPHLDPVLRREFLKPGEPHVDRGINEVWLFHGTKLENITSIHQDGFDYEKASNGLYGKWIYLTDSPQKADPYAGGYKIIYDHFIEDIKYMISCIKYLPISV